MASNTSPVVPVPTNNPYGLVVLDGMQYIERMQIFVDDVLISVPNELHTNLRLTMPGTANFLLKGLARDVTNPQPLPTNVPLGGSQDRRFYFKLTNMESTPWFFSSGLGSFDDRVVDSLCFGNGQFPYMLVPPIPVQGNGTLIYEIEDTGINLPDDYPYLIHLVFIGTYLIPVQQAGAAQSWLYSVTGGRK